MRAPNMAGAGSQASSLISKNWTPMANDFSSWFTTLRGRSHGRSELLALDSAKTWAGCTFLTRSYPTHRNTIM